MKTTHAYYTFLSLYWFGFSLVLVKYALYLRSLGLTLGEISLINAWFLIACLMSEIPTGIFADRVGRAASVRFGTLVVALSSLLYATADGFITAVIYEMLVGAGMSFANGALDAWLKDTLHHEWRNDEYDQAVRTGELVQNMALLVGGLIGSGLAFLIGY